MSMLINCDCEACGGPLCLECGEYMPDGALDLTLTCENECGAPVLNAFVPVADFIPVEAA